MAVIDFNGVPNPPYPAEDLYPSETLFPDFPSAGIAAPGVGTPTLVPVIEPVGIPRPALGTPEIIAGIRPPLRIDFWVVADDGTLLCPLPDVVSWDISLVPGEAGAVTIAHPVDGLHYDELNSRVTAERDLRIRIRTDGTDTTALGARLYASDGDEIAESGTRTFYGRFMTGDLDEAPLPYNPNGLKGEWGWADATAGDILHAVLTILQDAGYLAGFTWTFDGDYDSNGVAWASQTSPRFSPGRTAMEVAQQLREWGMLEFEVSANFEVRAYEPAAVGRDHTLTDPPMIFRVGRDLAEAPRRTDVSAAATSLMIAGADGVYVEVTDPTAEATRGRKIGQFHSEGNLASSVAALAYGELELPRRVHGTDERTRALTFDQNQPVPLRELLPLDWVYDDTGSGLRKDRIAQIQVSQAQGEDRYTGGIVLGDLINSRDVSIQRQLSGLAGGQIITGTSVPSPSVDDGKEPGQVVGLAVTSAPYPTQDVTLAYVVATWTNVTENFDGTPMGDLSHYEIQFRYSGGLPELPTGWTPVPSVLGLSANWDGVVAGTPISVRVRAVDQFGRAGAWSDEEPHVTQSDADPPPIPSTPNVQSYLGILTIEWDGLGSAGEIQPPDFSHVEVHASLSAGFTPDRPLNADGTLDTEASTTYIDRLTGAGTMPSTVGNYGETWYSRLVAVDKSANASTASAVDSAVLVQAGDGDIGSVSIGKLTAGIMSALMTISGIIRTASTGARVELDTTGLRCYSSTGALLFEFNIPSSLLNIAGKLTAGAGVGVGSTIVIEPTSPPRIRLYPTATNQRTELSASSTLRPDGSTAAGFALNTLNSSGQTDGFGIDAWSTNVWIGHKIPGDEYDGAILILERTGVAQLQTEGAFFQAGAAAIMGNDTGARVTVHDNGDIRLEAGADRQITASRPLGSQGAGFSFECQDGGTYPPEGIRTYASQGTIYFIDNASNTYVGDGAAVAAGRKTFVIDHPTDPARHLVHVAVEGPRDGVEYSGIAEIHDGKAIVELPDYFEALTQDHGREVIVSPILPDEPEPVSIEPPPLPRNSAGIQAPAFEPSEAALIPRVAASLPRNGRFRIASTGPDGSRVSWLVKAVRKDVPPLEVEPLRSDVDVHGDGPYTYLTSRAREAG